MQRCLSSKVLKNGYLIFSPIKYESNKTQLNKVKHNFRVNDETLTYDDFARLCRK